MKILKIGYEFEVLFPLKEHKELSTAFLDMSPDIYVGEDATVWGGKDWKDVEIKTKPLSPASAKNLFREIIHALSVLESYGQAKANKTCGLHVNVSSENNSKSFMYLLDHYDDKHYLKLWGRLDNVSCPPLDWFGNTEKYRNDLYEYLLAHKGEKYNSIAFRAGDGYNTERLENRIIGGKNYFLRTEDLDNTIRDFFNTIEQSS